MTPDEKYLFDLNGYIVVENVLTPAEVALANEGIDKHIAELHIRTDSLANNSPTLSGNRGRGELGGMMAWEEPYGSLFRSTLGQRNIVPHLTELLGRGFRVDHLTTLFTMDKGTEGFYFHGHAGPNWDASEFYLHRNGKMYCGLTVVSLQLTDCNPGDGGFAVVPGSHKANFNAPHELLQYEKYQDMVRQITYKAGDAVIFTEALTHGTLPWTSDQPRRTLLTRYHRGSHAYVPAKEMPAWAGERERILLQPPFHTRLNRATLPD